MSRVALQALLLTSCITFDRTLAEQKPPPGQELDLDQTEMTGTAVATLGSACTKNTDCGSSFCVDGFCCSSACNGQCQACNDGADTGTCKTITGTPRGGRTPCAGAGACIGVCDGASATACAYPTGAAVCGGSCGGTCDGAGGCTAAGSCALGYACVNDACATSCTSPSDCVTNFTCVGTECKRIPESDCLDNTDNNGDGLVDCEDPTCTDVECAPTGAGGTSVGYLTASACEAGFMDAATLSQGLQQTSSCTGCTCSVLTTCVYRTQRFMDAPANCTAPSGTSSIFNLTVNARSDQALSCGSSSLTKDPPSLWVKVDPQTDACVPAGAATIPSPTWTSTQSFCRTSQSSPTCGANAMCVRKRTGGVCLRTPGTAACGADYPIDSGVHYTGFTPLQCDSCPASCNVAVNGVCSTTPVIKARSDGCAATPTYVGDINLSGDTVGNNTCRTDGVGGYAWSGFRAADVSGHIVSQGTCSITQPGVAAASTPTGASRVCCR